ncbi:MAG: exonuclease SbcD [Mariniblastus sp.]|jgi:exonuclease SbcD
MAETVKFIHASDLHLDVSISGLTELPNHLIQTLANSPYDAALKIFDLAVAERVDFVLLAGDLFDFESGNARAASFLLAQFERLAEKDIHVYWCAGECDQPDRWPSSIELPENVVTFSSSIVEQLDHRRDGEVVARIMASGFDPQRRSGADFSAPDSEVFNIALTHGEFESTSLNAQNIRYWALGGRHKSTKLEKTGTIVVYPGSPQGRTPKETGIHGFRFCRVDSNGKLRVQTVESDRVRWMPQKVAISEQVLMGELKNELGERALKIMTDTTDQVVLCRWFLATEGDFNPGIRKREWRNDLLDWLRDEFGRSDKGLWSISLDVEAPKNLPIEWYEEDTLLGEYLRAMGRYQSDESLKLNLHEYMPQTVKNKVTEGMALVLDSQRDTVLRKSTMVGVEYLAKHKEFAHSQVDED